MALSTKSPELANVVVDPVKRVRLSRHPRWRFTIIALACGLFLGLVGLVGWYFLFRERPVSVDLSPSVLDFHGQEVGTRSEEQTLTITNRDAIVIRFRAVTISGAHAKDFIRTADSCTGNLLTPGSTCAIRIAFVPPVAESRHANLSMALERSNTPRVIPMVGTGVAPSPVFSPKSLAFDGLAVQSISPPLIVSLTNGSSAPLAIADIAIIGDSASDFLKTADTCNGRTVVAGKTCAISIAFGPRAIGARVATLSITDNAADSPQVVPLNGTGIADGRILGLSSKSLDFGSKQIQTTSAPQTVTLTNSGGSPVAISQVDIVGSDASAFQKTTDSCSGQTFDSGTGCTIRVMFAPSAATRDRATLVIMDDAADSPQSVALGGTGIVTGPAIDLHPTALDFQSQPLTSRSPVQTITLTNTGSVPLKIDDVMIQGPNADDFVVISTSCTRGPIASGRSCTIRVSFAPKSSGSRNANLTLTDNAEGSPQALPVTGIGIAPGPVVSVTSLDFGAQPLLTKSPPRTVSITNSGTAPARIRTISVAGTSAGDFVKDTDTCAGTMLASNQSCAIGVIFTPRAASPRGAILAITTDAGTVAQNVILTGVGVTEGASAVNLSASILEFSGVAVNRESPAQTVTLTNTGTAPVKVSDVAIQGTSAGDFVLTSSSCDRGTITAGRTCTAHVVFAPKTPGRHEASLTISNSVDSNSWSVPLSGTGTVPGPVVSVSSLDFGGQQLHTKSTPRSIVLTNNGTAAWKIRSDSLSGPDAGDFVKDTDTCAGTTLAPGQSCALSVAYSPKTAATHGASLIISDDAVDSPRRVALSGTGTG